MTDLATTPTAAAAEPAPRRRPQPAPPRTVGVWRLLSFVAVVAAVVLTIVFALQSRDASDDVANGTPSIDLEATSITVLELQVPDGAQVASLSHDGTAFVAMDNGAARLDIPSVGPSLVGLFDGNGDLHGLAMARSGQAGGTVTVSARSTARVLAGLSPALLDPDLGLTQLNLDSIEGSDVFENLVAVVASSPNLTQPNAPVEIALAALLDIIPDPTPAADQGCDSIADPRAFTAAGTCVRSADDGSLTVSNEQYRWVLLFSGPAPYSSPCAAIAHASRPSSQVTVAPADCTGPLLFSSPGAIPNGSDEAAAIIADRIHAAAAIEVAASYAAPFADQAGGAAGSTLATSNAVVDAPARAVNALGPLLQDPAFVAALDVLIAAPTPVERHSATIAAARLLLSDPTAAPTIVGFDATRSTHLVLFDLYDRTGEQMNATDRTARKWIAESSAIVEFDEAGQ